MHVPEKTAEPCAPWPEFRHIKVTSETEVVVLDNFESQGLTPDLNLRIWERKLICIPANQIESSDSEWLNSEPEVNVAGKNEDGKSYEIVIHISYVQWLSLMGFDQYLDYDPTAPVKEDILVHGTREAIKRSRARFLQKAANRIRSGYCQGYEECCRNIAISNGLQIPLERALLIHDDLESDHFIREHLVQHFVFDGLDTLRKYDSCESLELPEKNQDDLLQPFQRDVFRRVTGCPRQFVAFLGGMRRKLTQHAVQLIRRVKIVYVVNDPLYRQKLQASDKTNYMEY